uniref:Secreted protein n=1 Tax=Caenorhabditis japonica TaxID=281687 RepID=A0A8R1HLL6_CAEJA
MQFHIFFSIFFLLIGSSFANIYNRPDIHNAKLSSVASFVPENQTAKRTYTKTQDVKNPDDSKETRTCTLTVEGAPGDECQGYNYVVEVTKKGKNSSSSSSRQCSAKSCSNHADNIQLPDCPAIFPQYQELCDFSQEISDTKKSSINF